MPGGEYKAPGSLPETTNLSLAANYMNVLIRLCRTFAAVGLLAALPLGVLAQQIDPAVLGRIQQQLGSAASDQPSPSPVDAARASAATSALPQAKPETPSERALRELEARGKLDETRGLLPIEADFQRRLNDRTLRLFGYDLFESGAVGATSPLTGQISDSYVLGVGDEIVLQLRGSTNRSVTTRIDREGRLILDQMPPVSAAGRTLGAVRRDVDSMTRATLLGTDAYLSVGSVRTISVLVSGEVNAPGLQVMTSLNDVVTAILQAGGVRRGGSLRSIRVLRAGGEYRVDLYGLLGLADAPRVRLQDGDRIVVPPLGRTVAISGAVARPGIFELPGGRSDQSLGSLLTMAGGTIRPRGNLFTISRISPTGLEQVSQANDSSFAVKSGDGVVVTPQERGVVGQVRLSGAVDSPGLRALETAPTVKALLGGSRRSLKTGSYLPFAVLQRIDPLTNAPEMTPVSLLSVFSGRDVPLRSGDELFILDQAAIQFLQSDFLRQAVLGASDTKFPCRSIVALRASVEASQSDRFIDLLRGAFLTDRNGRIEANSSTATVTQASLGAGRGVSDVSGERAVAADSLKVRLGDSGAVTAEGCALLFEENEQLLPFILENLVVISGAVRRPGAYPLADSVPLSSLITIAGGYSSNADTSAAEVVDVLGDRESSIRREINFATSENRPQTISVTAGDDVRIPSLAPVYEPGAILLSGEVARPGLYSIRKGETLTDVLRRAGGVTEQAYPYGSVFTRRSVKQAQADGFKRTARELNSALLAVTARRNVNAEGIAAAAALARSFEDADAVGRVVVEADPRVLNQRADLNTTLEAGDALFIPKRPNFVLAVGDVLNPGALQFAPGKKVSDYLREAGGMQQAADKRRIFLVYPNGVARPVSMGAWTRSDLIVPPGSTIVIPKNIDPLRGVELFKDLATIVGQLAVSLASVAVLSTN
jgi:polysaccharide biosynthesis/export protein